MLSAKLPNGGEVVTIFENDKQREIIDYISAGRAKKYDDLPADEVWFNCKNDYVKFTSNGSSIYLDRTKIDSGDHYVEVLRSLET